MKINKKRGDELVAKYTGFRTMEELLTAGGDYRPSVSVSGRRDSLGDAEREVMADMYDSLMTIRGDDRRAYRY